MPDTVHARMQTHTHTSAQSFRRSTVRHETCQKKKII